MQLSQQLEQLLEQVAQERVRLREIAAELEQAKIEVENAALAIADGYANEDEKTVAKSREFQDQAAARVTDLQYRVHGAELRVGRAEDAVKEFKARHGDKLLEEQLAEAEKFARKTAGNLTRAAHEAVRLHAQYVTDRDRIQKLVAELEPGAGSVNGPPAAHPWERQMTDLTRVVREHDEVPPPLPRWLGRAHRSWQDEVHRKLKQGRRKGKEIEAV